MSRRVKERERTRGGTGRERGPLSPPPPSPASTPIWCTIAKSPHLWSFHTAGERERGGGEGEDGVKGEGERHKGRSRGCDAMRVDKYERSRNSVVLVSAHFSICAGFLFNRDLYYNIGVNSFKKRSL